MFNFSFDIEYSPSLSGKWKKENVPDCTLLIDLSAIAIEGCAIIRASPRDRFQKARQP
jgi:hypothetical protein